MKKAALIGLMALAFAGPAEARRCINGTVMAPNGLCVSPAQLEAMPKPQPRPQTEYRSCPTDFVSEGGRCVPVKRCPYDSRTCSR